MPRPKTFALILLFSGFFLFSCDEIGTAIKKITELDKKTANKGQPSIPVIKPPEEAIVIVNPGGIRLVKIPKGTFNFGSPQIEWGRGKYDLIPEQVTIPEDFYISMTEITQKQYELVMKKLPPGIQKKQDDLPVSNVTFQDAIDFCKIFNVYCKDYSIALPDEVEWEYAARANQTTSISLNQTQYKTIAKQAELLNTNNADNMKRVYYHYCWSIENSVGTSHPVGEKIPNTFGLYDMNGNVWEWCMPVEQGKYSISVSYPITGYKPVRGGAWISAFSDCRAGCRNLVPPDEESRSIGFRIVARRK